MTELAYAVGRNVLTRINVICSTVKQVALGIAGVCTTGIALTTLALSTLVGGEDEELSEEDDESH